MNRTEIRAAISLASVYVLRMLGLFMVMPVMALLAQDFKDYSPLLVGLAIGGYGLTQALLQIPMGMLSDRIGRKPVILLGLAFFAIGSGIAASADSLLWVVIGRMLQGTGAIAGAVMALAGDVSRDSERSKVMAIIGIAIGFSFYVSLLIGPPLANSYGLEGIFTVTAFLAMAAMPLIWWVVPNATNKAPSGDTLPVLEDIKRLFFDQNLMRLNMSVCVLHMLITILFMQLPALLSAHDYTMASQWQVYLPVLLLSIVTMAGLMSMARRGKEKGVLLSAVLLLSIAFLGLGILSQQFLLVMLFSIVFFTGFNYLEANFPAMVSGIAPAGKKGSAMGVYASFQFLGAFIGGAMAGVVTQYASVEVLFVATAFICLLWALWLKGLQTHSAAKRFSLPIELASFDANVLSEQLGALKGVQDITVISEERVAYLKVNGNEFDMGKAQQIVSTN
ncbi:MFS transporter [Aestuariibacter sp. AA17]|uniref:MFS transporter n=1 Tax=Fluctibacter corallii TaxID=2984329 RepID=A0ABT3ACF4_9ALTE|nr:MFS transporter [Aestuariibacter sp. AA17]MCV2886262.1 MFS transporter [Aestuariibacter sp. AA17]